MTAPVSTGPLHSAQHAHRERLAVAAIALGAFTLRLIHLGQDSLWYDETVSVYLAGQRAAELIAHTARDIHPPLYYLLLRGWLSFAGYPTGRADPAGHGLEFMAAFLSLLFGVLLVPLTWQLARRLRLPPPAPWLSALLIAFSPFSVWYSQEVRMYTLGAVLGVLVLLATLPFLERAASPARLRRAAVLYAVAAALGMYTLYYFAFLLTSLNLLVALALLARPPLPLGEGRGEGEAARSEHQPQQADKPLTFYVSPFTRLSLWLAAQAGALLLYLPWLPIAWRQATNPPVPPWRTAPQLLDVIVESWTALTLGQSADPASFWPLLVLALALLVLGILSARRSPIDHSQFTIHSSSILLIAVFGPLLLILMASLWTPLYHVRYLFIYSPAWSILLAMGITALWRRETRLSNALALTSLFLLLAGSAVALRNFWNDPAFTADDHRAAVRELAQRWRPGDVILVNAGYAYTALLTYWPGPIAWHGRLIDYTQDEAQQAAAERDVVILQTGHVDGDPGIGWGNPRSDFYALPREQMQTALRDLSAQTDRLWHYRIYDTVNDPQGAIRNALAAGWTLIDDRVYSGEANLRVQSWQGMRPLLSSYLPPEIGAWGEWLAAAAQPDVVPGQVEAGEIIDVPGVQWRVLAGRPGYRVHLSLRLSDNAGEIWAIYDEPLGGNQQDLRQLSTLVQSLRLAVPLGTPPGEYTLDAVIYDPDIAKIVQPYGTSARGDHAVLGTIQVSRPAESPALRPAVADFGPLRLVEATTPVTVVPPGAGVPVDLLWQAAPDFQGEPLVVVIQLLDQDGQVAASLEAQPLDGRYPTTQWQPGELVRDRHRLPLPDDLAPGTYSLIVGLYRAAEGQRLMTGGGPLGWRSTDVLVVSEIIVQ